MPRSKSKLGLSERRERAYQLFARGWTNAAVAKELKVHADTVAGYRAKYEDSIHAQAAANPNFLKDVLQNTIRSLAELDQIRADAWKHMEDRKVRVRHECPECGHAWKEIEVHAVSDQSRAQYLNVLLKAQDQRSKLFGVLGVKQEVLVAILQVKTVQDKVLDWLGEHVTGDLREELATFLESPELAAYMGNARPALDAIDVEGAEVLERAG